MKRRVFSVLSIFMLILFIAVVTYTLVVYLKNPGLTVYDIIERDMLGYIIALSALIIFFIWGNSIK
jgi:hypothetical protein